MHEYHVDQQVLIHLPFSPTMEHVRVLEPMIRNSTSRSSVLQLFSLSIADIDTYKEATSIGAENGFARSIGSCLGLVAHGRCRQGDGEKIVPYNWFPTRLPVKLEETGFCEPRTDVSLEVQFFTRDCFTMISFKISFRGLLYVQWPPSVKPTLVIRAIDEEGLSFSLTGTIHVTLNIM
jgi:hypothetical protein